MRTALALSLLSLCAARPIFADEPPEDEAVAAAEAEDRELALALQQCDLIRPSAATGRHRGRGGSRGGDEAARCRQAAQERIDAAHRARADRDADQERADDERAIDALRADRTALRVTWSALACVAASERTRALAQMVEERGMTRAIDDGAVLFDIVRRILAADEQATRSKSELAHLNARPASCRSPLVARVAACIGQPLEDDCAASDVRHHLALLDAE